MVKGVHFPFFLLPLKFDLCFQSQEKEVKKTEIKEKSQKKEPEKEEKNRKEQKVLKSKC